MNKKLYLTSRKKYPFLEEQSSEVQLCRFLSARRFVTVRVLNIGYLFRASSITHIEDLLERWGFNLSKKMRQWMTSFPIEDVVVRDKTMPNEEGVTSWGTGTYQHLYLPLTIHSPHELTFPRICQYWPLPYNNDKIMLVIV